MKAKVEITFDSATENYGIFKDAVGDFLKSLEAKKISDGEDLQIKVHVGEKILLMEDKD